MGPESGPGGEQEVRMGFQYFPGDGGDAGVEKGEFVGHRFECPPGNRRDIGGRGTQIEVG